MWTDIIIVLVIALFGVFGALRGFIRQAFALIGVVAMALFAVPLGVMVATPIAEQQGWGPTNATRFKIGASLVAALVIYVVVMIIGRWVNRKIGRRRFDDNKSEMARWNRQLGALLGILKGAVLCWLILCFFVAFSRVAPGTVSAIEESRAVKSTEVFNPFEYWMPPGMDEALVALWNLKQHPGAYEDVMEEESIARVLDNWRVNELLDGEKGTLLDALRDEEFRKSFSEIDWPNVARVANRSLARGRKEE